MMTFPILLDYRERIEWRAIGGDDLALWDVVAAHGRQAKLNHGGQDLLRLSERGGLGPSELAAVLEDRPWRTMSFADALAVIRAAVERAGDGSAQ
jgi:hypothetical protein